MEIANQRIVIWCGSASNQRALANKIAKKFPVVGIVIDEKKRTAKSRKLLSIPLKIWDHLRFNKIYQSWKQLLQYYQGEFPQWPDLPTLRVDNINKIETIEFTNRLKPTLIIVSGTSMVKKEPLAIPVEKGILNLHTGLSPFVKGGPNCTNWCVANNEWQLVGNTIMWISAGIDSGDIVTSETVDIRTSKTLFDAHKTVMEHAHDLYLRAINYVLTSSPPFQAVSQASLGEGNLYLTKMWTSVKRAALLKNWARREKVEPAKAPVTVALPSMTQP